MTRDGERSRIVFPALAFLALLLLAVPESSVDSARARVLSLLNPVLSPFAAWKAPAPRVASIQNLEATSPDKPVEMPAPNTSAETDYNRARIVQLENELEKLRRTEPFANLSGKIPPGVDANVIIRKILWQEPILGLDRGEADGLRMNAGVLHRGAVLGRIVGIGPHGASLALLTHRGMSIAARLSDCRVEGVLQGAKAEENGERFCHMAIVAREAAPKVGENVVTSGYDGAFPSGLWMGVVTAVRKTGDFQWELTIRPACNDNAVEIVHVLTGSMPEVPWPAAPGVKRGAR